jgi:DNA-binding MarR family transcriptional regulator
MARRSVTARQLDAPAPLEEVWAPLRMGTLPDKLGVCLRFAQNQVFREIALKFAPFGVTPLLYSVLTLIEANPNCRQADVGAALGVKQPNLVEKINNLVERGLVTRLPDPSDRRANVLALTPTGQRFLADLTRTDEALCASFEARLGPADHAALLNLLKRLARGA